MRLVGLFGGALFVVVFEREIGQQLVRFGKFRIELGGALGELDGLAAETLGGHQRQAQIGLRRRSCSISSASWNRPLGFVGVEALQKQAAPAHADTRRSWDAASAPRGMARWLPCIARVPHRPSARRYGSGLADQARRSRRGLARVGRDGGASGIVPASVRTRGEGGQAESAAQSMVAALICPAPPGSSPARAATS